MTGSDSSSGISCPANEQGQVADEANTRRECSTGAGGQLKWLLGAGLALLTALVFLPSISNGFVAWDDGFQIYENPHLGLGWKNLKWMFTDYDYAHRYLPLGWLSYSVDRAFFGGGPLSYHVGNVMFHTLNTVLVFVLLRQLLLLATKRKDSAGKVNTRPIEIAAALGALWWAINPLRVEAVAWASARIYGVAIALVLVAVLSYLRANRTETRSRRWLLLAVLCYAMSLFTYPIALGGFVIFLALDLYPLRRLPFKVTDWVTAPYRRVLAEKSLFLLPGILMFAITFVTRLGNPALGAVFENNQASIGDRVMQAFYVWTYYVWKPWSPFHLAPEYSTLLDFNPWSARFVISAVAIAALTILFWFQRKSRPALLIIWVCHLVLLVPVLGMETFRHYHTTDRYGYLQGLCWAMVLAAGAFALASRPRLRMAFATAIVVWVGFCAFLIPSQIAVWKDSLSLHTRIVESLGRNGEEKSGSRVRRDWARHETFLGQLQMEANQLAGAEASFRHALATDAKLPESSLLLAKLLFAQKRGPEALDCLESTVRLHPEDVRPRMMLAVIHGDAGNLSESARRFEEVLRLTPQDAMAHHNFAVTLERLGNTNGAAVHYAKAKELREPPALAPH